MGMCWRVWVVILLTVTHLVTGESTFKVAFPGSGPLGMQLGGSNPVTVLGFQKDANGLPRAAESDGRIKVRDAVVSVNGVVVKSVNDVTAQLSKHGLSERVIIFSATNGRVVSRVSGESGNRNEGLASFCIVSAKHGHHKLVGIAAEHAGSLPRHPLRLVAAQPRHACGELKNEALLRNAVVVVERGTCTFRDKVFSLQYLGVKAVIIINSDNEISDRPVVHDPNGALITTGVVMVPSSKAKLLFKLAQETLASPNERPSLAAFVSSTSVSSQSKSKSKTDGVEEFSVGPQEDGELVYAWWNRQYFQMFPREAECRMNKAMTQHVSVDAALVRFRSVKIDGNGSKNRKGSNDHTTRYYDSLKAIFGPKIETCPWGCGLPKRSSPASSSVSYDDNQASRPSQELQVLQQDDANGDAFFIATNTSVSGLLVTTNPSFGCVDTAETETGGADLTFTPPLTAANLAVAGVGSASNYHWLFVAVWRGGGCNFDTKAEEVYSAVRNTLPADIVRTVRVVLLVVNSEASLFHPEPTLSSSVQPPVLVMMLPKAAGPYALTYAERPVGGPDRLGIVDFSLATPLIAAYSPESDKSSGNVGLASSKENGAHVSVSSGSGGYAGPNTNAWVPESDVSMAWHEIRMMTSESESMWEQERKARKKQYIERAKGHHPDKGGSQDRFEALLLAYKRASFFLDRDDEDVNPESFDDLV